MNELVGDIPASARIRKLRLRLKAAASAGKAASSAALFLLCAACATQPVAPVVTLLPPKSYLVVLQLPTSVSDASLKHVFHAGEKDVTPAELAADRQRLETLVSGEVAKAFAASDDPVLRSAQIVPPRAESVMAIGRPLDAASLAQLRSRHPADAYIRLQITDYGQTPSSWKTAYITFEVVTTAGIAALLYAHKVTRALAGVYLIQEGVEEYSEGYAGFWLFNRLSRPVRIEADLIDGSDGAVLWHDSETGLAGWKWTNPWHIDEAARDALLKTSTDKMADKLAAELTTR